MITINFHLSHLIEKVEITLTPNQLPINEHHRQQLMSQIEKKVGEMSQTLTGLITEQLQEQLDRSLSQLSDARQQKCSGEEKLHLSNKNQTKASSRLSGNNQ